MSISGLEAFKMNLKIRKQKFDSEHKERKGFSQVYYVKEGRFLSSISIKKYFLSQYLVDALLSIKKFESTSLYIKN